MNILVIEAEASSQAGGAENSMRRFCEHLAKEHQVYLAYSKTGDYVASPEQEKIYSGHSKLNLSHLRLDALLSWSSDLQLLRKIIKKNNIEVILTHVIHVTPMLRVLKWLTGTPVVMYYKWVCSFEDVGLKLKWGNRGVTKAAAVSRYVANYWIRNGILAQKMKVVPEGVKAFQNEIERMASGLNKVKLGFAGRIVPEKGLEDLFYALQILKSESPQVILSIAGRFHGQDAPTPNPYHVQLEQMLEDLSITELVQFEGFVSPFENWLSRVDLVVVPSTCQDAQPLVMMQAMAAGKAVVATQVGGIPEVLSEERTQFLVQPNSPEQLAKKLSMLMQQKTKLNTWGKENQSYILKNYSMSNHNAQLTAILNQSH